MHTKLILAVAALGFATLTQTAQAQTQSGQRSLTRAEVNADLALWRRAGLEGLATNDGFDLDNPEYQQRLSTYQRWRAGPEFQAQVQRLSGGSALAKAPGGALSN